MGFEVHSYSIQHQWKDRNDPKELVTCSRERGPDLTTPKLKLDTQLPETEVGPLPAAGILCCAGYRRRTGRAVWDMAGDLDVRCDVEAVEPAMGLAVGRVLADRG